MDNGLRVKLPSLVRVLGEGDLMKLFWESGSFWGFSINFWVFEVKNWCFFDSGSKSGNFPGVNGFFHQWRYQERHFLTISVVICRFHYSNYPDSNLKFSTLTVLLLLLKLEKSSNFRSSSEILSSLWWSIKKQDHKGRDTPKFPCHDHFLVFFCWFISIIRSRNKMPLFFCHKKAYNSSFYN